jgi:hypothetical protein
MCGTLGRCKNLLTMSLRTEAGPFYSGILSVGGFFMLLLRGNIWIPETLHQIIAQQDKHLLR